MDWDDLRTFLAVAQEGTIRGAAKALKVNHSTVSRRIKAFEDRLQVRLFERQPSGYVLTPAGEDVLSSAQLVKDQVDGLQRRVLGQDTRLTGTLRVTLPDLLAIRLLAPDLAAFSSAYPGIDLEVIVSYETLNLSRREADIAIRITNSPPETLVGRSVARYCNGTYASPAYLEAHDLNKAPQDACWIGWDEVVTSPKWVLNSDFPDMPVRYNMANALLQLEAAKAGLGVSKIPCFLGDPEPGVVRVPGTSPEPSWNVWLLTHEDLRHTARVRAFMDFMAKAFAKHTPLLEGQEGA